ncbi:MAG: hypothetical protein NC293_06045 [Roseburia sp.]|nr:hypothetical protein [Roseburia sp.]
MKRKIAGYAVVFLMAVMTVCLPCRKALAASASVEFTVDKQEIRVGGEFTVVCRVDSSEEFSDVKMDVLYDAQIMEFVEGGKKVSGGNGVLHISSVKNSDAVKKRTYSLKFKALMAGTGMVEADSGVEVSNASGTKFSISSNRFSVSVMEADEGQTGDPSEVGTAPSPEETPDPVLSTNNKLKSLRFDCLSMTPEFDTNVLDYTVKVDCNTSILYFNYIASNKKAAVRIKDNEELLVGENNIKVVVTAESGDKRVFKIKVLKESESETKVREQEEKGTSDITFSVYEKDGSVFIQNQYQFEVVDVQDETVIPSGYVKTSVDLEGKNVTAYTMENDLDNNYLLMYLKGAGAEPTLYQYDRQEKTIQRYTGTMTQKVNKGGTVSEEPHIDSGAWVYAALVALMVLVIVLLIVILNMILKRKIGKGKKELDDMDF